MAKTVSCPICRLPAVPDSDELVNILDKVRQTVVSGLEASACQSQLVGALQSIQACLVKQGLWQEDSLLPGTSKLVRLQLQILLLVFLCSAV